MIAVPALVSQLIKDRRLPNSRGGLSFVEIVARLKANRFKIMAGGILTKFLGLSVASNRQSRQEKGSKRSHCKDSYPTTAAENSERLNQGRHQ
jgi:hypothetical protein